MATPTIIVPGAGGVEVASTLVRAWYAGNTALANPGDFQFRGDTVNSDPSGVYSSSTGNFTAKVAGRYVATMNLQLTNSNLDDGRNQPYIQGFLNGVTVQAVGGRCANDNFWTNRFWFHVCAAFDMLVNDTVGFFITQHGSGALTAAAGGSGGSGSYCELAKVG